MTNPVSKPEVRIRDLETIADLQAALDLEREIWDLADRDVMPLTLAVAMRGAGAMWIGAYDKTELLGFAFAFPSLEHRTTAFHSHLLAVRRSYRGLGIGWQLKLAQRQRALILGVREMSWTFDPLRAENAHLNFNKLGVVSQDYRIDFYGPQTSSPLHTNGTDRLWVIWPMAERRVEERLRGKHIRADVIDALKHLEPLVRFNGNGRPVEIDLSLALSRQRIAIEIPGNVDRIEHEDKDLARQWRLATRRAFTAALAAGFIVKEFCRSIRGQQGPGAYLLEKAEI